jgi:hypothetical protein
MLSGAHLAILSGWEFKTIPRARYTRLRRAPLVVLEVHGRETMPDSFHSDGFYEKRLAEIAPNWPERLLDGALLMTIWEGLRHNTRDGIHRLHSRTSERWHAQRKYRLRRKLARQVAP